MVLNKRKVQFFNWGEIEWLKEPHANKDFSVGIVRVTPGSQIKKHLHFGDNQIYYIFNGQGVQWLDDEKMMIYPGFSCDIRAGQTHRVYNPNDEVLSGLLISTASSNDFADEIHNINTNINIETINWASMGSHPECIRIKKNVEKELSIPISILDTKGNCIFSPSCLPAVCELHCRIKDNLHNCIFYNILKAEHEHYASNYADICNYGVLVLNVPIVFCNQIIGFIKAGHIEKSELPGQDSLLIPKSRTNATYYGLKKMASDMIKAFLLDEVKTKNHIFNELVKKISLEEIVDDKFPLQKNYNDKLLSNNMTSHSLYNILNIIASLSMKENAMDTYDAIVNLSNLLRYHNSTDPYIITVKEECDFISSYIKLLQLNLKTELNFSVEFDKKLENYHIPQGIISPLIENAIIHGFNAIPSHLKPKIKLSIEICNEKIHIIVKDNGAGFNDEKKVFVEQTLRNDSDDCQLNTKGGNGFKLINALLHFYYGDLYKIKINSNKDGSSVLLEIPYSV